MAEDVIYSSANMQADLSSQKPQILPVTSKMHLTKVMSENTLPWARDSQGFFLTHEKCTQTLMEGGVFLILINSFCLGKWKAERANVFAQS